jgi:hypothetical protein
VIPTALFRMFNENYRARLFEEISEYL